MLVASSFSRPLANGDYPFPDPAGADRDLTELPAAFALVIVAAAVFLIFLVSLVVGRRWLVTSYGLTALGVGATILSVGAVWVGADLGDITFQVVILPAFTRLATGLVVGAVGLFCWYPAWEDTRGESSRHG